MYPSRESSVSLTPIGTPQPGQMPKYGTLIPNRIFVGGISADMSEGELKQFFSAYGAVKDCKIITDRGGVSKSYGFVTFESHEDADRIICKQAYGLIFKDRKLNIGPAVRKQQGFTKYTDGTPGVMAGGPTVNPSQLVYINGYNYALNNGLAAVYCNPDGSAAYILPAQSPAMASVMISPQSYLSHAAAAAAYQQQLQQQYHQQPNIGVSASQSHIAPDSHQVAWTNPQMSGGSQPAMIFSSANQQYMYPLVYQSQDMHYSSPANQTDNHSHSDQSTIEPGSPATGNLSGVHPSMMGGLRYQRPPLVVGSPYHHFVAGGMGQTVDMGGQGLRQPTSSLSGSSLGGASDSTQHEANVGGVCYVPTVQYLHQAG